MRYFTLSSESGPQSFFEGSAPAGATEVTQEAYDAALSAAVMPPVQPVTPATLIAYAAAARYRAETAGVTVSGIKIATDRDSQALITGAWATAQIDPSSSFQWKAADGSWSTLTAAQITAIATAVSRHVQACFAAEQQCDAGINASPPTITTTAQVDAVMTAISA